MRFVEWLMDILVASISRRSLTISVVLLLIYAVLALVVGSSWLATVDTEVLQASQRLAGIQLDYLLTALTPLATAEFSGWLVSARYLVIVEIRVWQSFLVDSLDRLHFAPGGPEANSLFFNRQ